MWPRILHGVRKEGGEPYLPSRLQQTAPRDGRPPRRNPIYPAISTEPIDRGVLSKIQGRLITSSREPHLSPQPLDAFRGAGFADRHPHRGVCGHFTRHQGDDPLTSRPPANARLPWFLTKNAPPAH